MCIALVAYQVESRYPLIVLANRDEFLHRPTQAMHLWPGTPRLWAGKDLLAGGSWFGVSELGRFALLTNHHGAGPKAPKDAPSRGQLITAYLRDEHPDFASHLNQRGPDYAGFNLIYGPFNAPIHYSNATGVFTTLSSGIHGLSNALLNTPWPKVERGKTLLERVLTEKGPEVDSLFEILNDSTPGQGPPYQSLIRIPSQNGYGSRCATVLRVDPQGRAELWERPYPSLAPDEGIESEEERTAGDVKTFRP